MFIFVVVHISFLSISERMRKLKFDDSDMVISAVFNSIFCNPESANKLLFADESFIGICVKAKSNLFQTEFGQANSRIVQLY